MSLVTLNQVKDHLRIERVDDAQDELLETYLLAAASLIESSYGLVAIAREQSFIVRPRTAARLGPSLTIPLRPVDVASVAVTRIDGEPIADRRVSLVDGWARVLPALGKAFPSTMSDVVTATVGFADDVGIDPCAGALRVAVLLWVEALYDGAGSATEPAIVATLLDGFRLRRV